MDFFFFIGSLYSYLAVEVRWRPVNLRAIMTEQNNIPKNNPLKLRYIWRDVERRAARHGLGFRKGLPYPIDPHLLANRIAAVAAEDGWCADYARMTYGAWFEDHQAPGDVDHAATILKALGKDPAAVLARAESAGTRSRYDAETEAARRLGIFGAPTFVAGEETFWGDDRLEEALEWARR